MQPYYYPIPKLIIALICGIFLSSYVSLEIHNTENNNEQFSFIEDYITNEGVDKTSKLNLKRFYSIDDHNLIITDSLSHFDLKSVKFDWILLRNSPKINLEKVIKILKPKLIIADGSNYKSYVKRWQKTCTKKVSIFMILLRMALLFMT